MNLNIHVENAEVVRKGLQNLSDEIPKIGRQQLRTVANRIVRTMQAYPPEPAGQSIESKHSVLGTVYRPAKGRYQRTGRLGHTWKITQASDGYSIGNDAARKGRRYAVYVVGNAFGTNQAWMHKGRWPVFRDVVDEEFSKLPPEIEKHIGMVARRNGLK